MEGGISQREFVTDLPQIAGDSEILYQGPACNLPHCIDTRVCTHSFLRTCAHKTLTHSEVHIQTGAIVVTAQLLESYRLDLHLNIALPTTSKQTQ